VDNFVEILSLTRRQAAPGGGFDRMMTKKAAKIPMKSTNYYGSPRAAMGAVDGSMASA
jgi:hypothetical protein